MSAAAARGAPRGGRAPGFSLVEVLVAVALTAIVAAGLGATVGTALDAAAEGRQRAALAREADFALERMARAVLASPRLLVPLAENPATPHSEAVREPGVLAVALDPARDADADGFADADNDRDGRVDEDPSGDRTRGGTSGLPGIDDDGDGAVDEGVAGDDDEDGALDEDPENGVDDDGDGSVDEDPPGDSNGDGAPGSAGIDDDGDSQVDEGVSSDDDEDGTSNEDWLDAVVFRLSGADLLERRPNPDPASGTDYTERVVASGVSRFRVERIALAGGRAVVVEITLDLTGAGGSAVSVATRVRVGAGR